jgi:hypothetical protein
MVGKCQNGIKDDKSWWGNDGNENKIMKMITMVTRNNMGVKVLNHFCLNIYSLFVFFSRIMERCPKGQGKCHVEKKNNWGAKKYHHKGVKRGLFSQATRVLRKMSREQHCSKLVACHEH